MCDDLCVQYGDCCTDYVIHCTDQSPSTITTHILNVYFFFFFRIPHAFQYYSIKLQYSPPPPRIAFFLSQNLAKPSSLSGIFKFAEPSSETHREKRRPWEGENTVVEVSACYCFFVLFVIYVYLHCWLVFFKLSFRLQLLH